MSTLEDEIAQHYANGALADIIETRLRDLGFVPGATGIDDLAPIDEFHTGGRQATIDLVEQVDLRPGTSVLDIGSGIGGTARLLAHRYGCDVTGIDVTPEFVAVAEALTRLVGLEQQARFQLGTAADLPFADGSFEAATLIHVGMNIVDKRRLCAEAARVLTRGGTFAIYDMMRTGEGELDYPVPWATTADTSFVEEPQTYRTALAEAGFEVVAERNRRAFALDFFATMKARLGDSGPPPLGLHILMGAAAPAKVANVMGNIDRGRIAPVEMICRLR